MLRRSAIKKLVRGAATLLIVMASSCTSDQTGLLEPSTDTAPVFARSAPLLANTKIAFSAIRDGDFEIYVMDADGSNPVNLTNDPAADGVPDWSPDGTNIAFATNRDGNFEVYVMSAHGGNPTNLTNHPAFDTQPAWSPDGSQLAFRSNRDGDFDIYVMAVNGTGISQLTNHPAEDKGPTWSPDGTRIAFTSNRDGNVNLFVVDVSTGVVTRLTDDPAIELQPSWSPDGTKIAFTREPSVYTLEVADPANVVQVELFASDPTWSPDGLLLAFNSFPAGVPGGTEDIFVKRADGTGDLVNLTQNPAGDGQPAWSPLLAVVVTVVTIDIKPGSDPNSINCKNAKGVVPVAILTTEEFDATTVDHTTVSFGPGGATEIHRKKHRVARHEKDVDGDGDVDLVFHFRFGDTGLSCGDTEAALTGETFGGTAITGTDAIRTVHDRRRHIPKHSV